MNVSKLLGGILLVSGTTIGAAMLAMPIAVGLAGFYPAIFLCVLYCLYMTYTSFLMLEVNLWMPPGTNLISMAKATLGTFGQIMSWVCYLFLLFALTTAYIAGGSPLLLDFINNIAGINLPTWSGPVLLILIFGFFIYHGTKSVDYVNRVLMIGFIITYFALVFLLSPHVDTQMLSHINWTNLKLGVSVVATSFGFQIIIPTLTTYLDRDVKMLRKVLIIGSLIPLFVYILWIWITLGILPLEGKYGLIEGYKQGADGAYLIAELLEHSWIAMIARFFVFFAIVTSLLGVSLSLLDFLSDGLKVKKTPLGKILLLTLGFGIPLFFVLTDPRAFFSGLEYAGVFGVVVLLGVLPILMVWSGRYYKNFASTFKTPGGKIALIAAMLFSLIIIAIEMTNKFI